MKKFSLYVVALGVLVGAGVAYAAASPSAKLQKQDRLYGGGQFGPGCFTPTLCFAAPRNTSVDAHAEADGAEAVGNSNYGTPGVIENTRSVMCLRVEANRAAIGGVITAGNNAGFGFVQYFVDRGGTGLGPRDLASPSFVDVLSSPDWPAGFPQVCPSPTTGFPGAEPVFLPLEFGDVVVQDATDD